MKKISTIIILFVAILIASCGSDKTEKVEAKSPKKQAVKTETKKVEPKKEAVKETPKEEAPKADPIPPEQIEKAKEIIASVSKEDIQAVDAKAKYKCSVRPAMDLLVTLKSMELKI